MEGSLRKMADIFIPPPQRNEPRKMHFACFTSFNKLPKCKPEQVGKGKVLVNLDRESLLTVVTDWGKVKIVTRKITMS